MNKKQDSPKVEFALERNNYVLMGIGLIAIVVGFLLLAGGKSDDPNVFNESMFNFQRITLAPLLLFGGFIFQIYAILKRPKKAEE